MNQTSSSTVRSLTCGHCVASVTEEVLEIPGVEDFAVHLPVGAATITSAESLDDAAVEAAVGDAGYQFA